MNAPLNLLHFDPPTSLKPNNTFTTFTRREVAPFHLKRHEVCIADIAHALSMICRYGGHCPEFYSVAQHSVLVACIAKLFAQAVFPEADDVAFVLGLFHDAPEAYLGDVITPLKVELGRGYKDAEARAWNAVTDHFGIDVSSSSLARLVKHADWHAYVLERRHLFQIEIPMEPDVAWWHQRVTRLGSLVVPERPPRAAEVMFLDSVAESEKLPERWREVARELSMKRRTWRQIGGVDGW
jgi:hypothetical protein